MAETDYPLRVQPGRVPPDPSATAMTAAAGPDRAQGRRSLTQASIVLGERLGHQLVDVRADVAAAGQFGGYRQLFRILAASSWS